MGAQGSDHATTLISLGVPAPGAIGIGSAAHQPIHLHQPGGAHGAVLQQSSGLLKEGHRAIFKIDGNAQSALDRFPLQFCHLLSIQRHRLLQQQVLSRLQGLQSQRMTRLRWCGDDHRINGWIGQQRIPVGVSLEA